MPATDQFTELLAAIYDAAGDAALWEEFLRKLAHTTRADSAALVMHQSGQEQHAVVAGWNIDPDGARLYRDHYGAYDIWAQQARAKRAGHVYTSEGLCHRSVFESSEFFNDFLVRNCISHGMFGTIENTAKRWATVSLYRNASSGEFEEEPDLQVLRRIVPHVQRAFRLHFQLSELKARSEGIETALNMLPTAIIFLKSSGELAVANRQAEELLRQRDGLLLENGKLRAAVSAEAKRLQNLMEGAEQTSNGVGFHAGGTIAVSRTVRRPLCVTVAPLPNFEFGLGNRPSVLVLVADPDQQIKPAGNLFRECYGLTAAEARLAMPLIEGHSLKEAAGICGVTYNTAKSQAKSIFVKTNVQRQSELVKVLLVSSGGAIAES